MNAPEREEKERELLKEGYKLYDSKCHPQNKSYTFEQKKERENFALNHVDKIIRREGY